MWKPTSTIATTRKRTCGTSRWLRIPCSRAGTRSWSSTARDRLWRGSLVTDNWTSLRLAAFLRQESAHGTAPLLVGNGSRGAPGAGEVLPAGRITGRHRTSRLRPSRMHFVFVFGPPAVGKMTVGRALAARTGYKLLHNHMTVEPVLEIFAFGSPPFGRLVSRVPAPGPRGGPRRRPRRPGVHDGLGPRARRGPGPRHVVRRPGARRGRAGVVRRAVRRPGGAPGPQPHRAAAGREAVEARPGVLPRQRAGARGGTS